VAGLALVVVLNVLLLLVTIAGPHVIRTQHIISRSTVTAL
jgi:hypothetical protein